MVRPTTTTRSLGGEASGRIGRVAGEDGYVIPMVGLLLIPLMVATAFAIDVGTFYARGTDLQRAVDMAAMAGVVWLPNTTKAQTEAAATLSRNGYSTSNATISYSVPTTTRYRVSATIAAPRFFSGVVAGGTQTITRASTAEYNKPVPLGSPENKFGNSLTGDLDGDGVLDAGECVDPAAACAGSQPLLWSSINSPYYANENGDPFATRCITGNSCSPDPNNGEYRANGYTYAIEAQAGQVVTVQLYDAPAYYNAPLNFPGDSGSFRVQYELFTEDGSALTTSTDSSLSMSTGGRCSSGPGRRAFPGSYAQSVYHNKWWTLCTFTAPTTGVYPLVVKTSNIVADASTGAGGCTACLEDLSSDGSTRRRGINSYSVRATVPSGTQPRIYGIGDMSIYTPTPNGTATFYLADVQPIHAGKKFVLDMYDPGDGSGSGTFTMEINGPGGVDFPCTLQYGGTNGLRGDTSAGSENYATQCQFLTRVSGSNRFNSRWVRLEINIPTSYTCSTDCWWKVTYNFGATGNPTDRTVWAVQIVGDPVHLTE